jgi:hypothetical protein
MLSFTKSCLRIAIAACATAIAVAVVSVPGYAREAVEQYHQSVRLRCDFDGARWSDQREAHFAWCVVSPSGVGEESRIRQRMLIDCAARNGGNGRPAGRPPEARHARCDTYAKIASVQANAARNYGCGLRDPEWSADPGIHYHWCMRNGRESVMDQLRFRTEELQRCFNRLGD